MENAGQMLLPEQVIGKSLWTFVTDAETCHLYNLILAKVRRQEIVRVRLRCDSPACRRFLELIISSLPDNGVQFESITYALENRLPVALLDTTANRSSQLLLICSWCKKIKVSPATWVDVEEAVSLLEIFNAVKLPNLTHGICDDCYKQLVETID